MPDHSKQSHKLSPSEIEMAVSLYQSGCHTGIVAERLGVSRSAIWALLRRRIQLRPAVRSGEKSSLYRGTKRHVPAIGKVAKAIERGDLVRPDKCEACGAMYSFKDGRSAIQAHHCDYNKPLEVMWLCQRCHNKWHRTNKAIPFSPELAAAHAIPSRRGADRKRLEGTMAGYWSVIEYLGKLKYRCQCACGKERAIPACSLLRGATRSCGCKAAELAIHTWTTGPSKKLTAADRKLLRFWYPTDRSKKTVALRRAVARIFHISEDTALKIANYYGCYSKDLPGAA